MSANGIVLSDNFSPLRDSQSSGAGDIYTYFEKMKKTSARESTSSSEGLLPDLNKHHSNSIEEQLYDNRAELKILTAHYAVAYINQNFKKQLFNQLDWLLDPESWVEGDVLAKPESFKTLIKFILNAKPKNAPSVGLSQDGNILATWQQEANKLILECLPKENIKWFVSCVFEEKKERASGEASTLKRLLAVLSPYKKSGWFVSE